MPCLKRPEFLALALEKISQTPQANRLDVRLYIDRTDDKRVEEIAYVRDTYLPTADLFHANEHITVLSGCWNILNALKAGYDTGAEFIFMIEEDVMIRPSFFSWNWETHESAPYFVTCGRRHGRMPSDFYSNPGTCYRRSSLKQIVSHINSEYFANNQGYLDKHFPTMIGMDGFLDDGLIRKVQRSIKGRVLCAEPSVAVHQGFRYYNRLEPHMNKGETIQERIQILREILSHVDPGSRYTHDFEPL